MKSTGLVRRIDDLGRVVIPKEIRRTLNIKEDDPLELFVEDKMVCFQKYNVNESYTDTIESLIGNLSDDMDIENAKEIKLKLNEALTLLNARNDED